MATIWRQTAQRAVRSCSSRQLRRAPTPYQVGRTATVAGRSCYSTGGHASALQSLLHVSEEVQEALATKKPVVALESTIYTHGAMDEDLGLEAIVRANGAVPAVIGILDGKPSVGLLPEEIERMVSEGAQKVSRRDMAYIVGLGPKLRKHGGTTISGTMILARLAGIRVFGTGGLGGVHRGWQDHMDISADLSELGRTRVAVVSSGSKGFLDVPATLEYLETQGVYVSTFADGRSPASDITFPGFWARDSDIPSPSVVADEAEAAAIILAQEQLGIETGLLFANPIPEKYAVPREQMKSAIETAVREAAEKGFSGNRNTPFVLGRIRELTDSSSVAANLALVRANVERAAKVAVELSALMEGGGDSAPFTSYPIKQESKQTQSPLQTKAEQPVVEPPASPRADILVAGSVALDLACDYFGDGESVSPQLLTSNPAAISPSVGGVGHNVALAAHRIGPSSKVKLCSLVGEDIAGLTVLTAMNANGMDTSLVRKLGPEFAGARTAHYVAVNDAEKNLMVAMADMGIFTISDDSLTDGWSAAVAEAQPKWLVVDGNWTPEGLRGWIRAARQQPGTAIAFEPVSTAKAARLFDKGDKLLDTSDVFPRPLVDLATPNQHELAAMHRAARENGYILAENTATSRWFNVIDALGIMSGARDRFARLTSNELTDAGVPVMSVQLLPYIPTLITKLGKDGALLTKLLHRNDPLLMDREAERHLLLRAPPSESEVGGIYMRLFPPAEANVTDVVSVNGVGDTFLGSLVAGLAQGGQVEKLMDVAQQAAVLSLRSRESVSDQLRSLADNLSRAAGKNA